MPTKRGRRRKYHRYLTESLQRSEGASVPILLQKSAAVGREQ
jgi:hypothetical protein